MTVKLFVFVSLMLLLLAVSIRNAKRKTSEIRVQNGQQFEILLCELFKKAGYKVRTTKFSHDFGADLLIENGGKLIVLQAKYYSRPIDTDAVEEAVVAGTIYGTAYVGVVTNNEIPERVKDFAKQFEAKTFVKKIYLIDSKALERLKRKERIV
ncbi:restriction endonuclease [Pseudothermotoga sp.]